MNGPDTKQVQVADVVKGTILARWPTTAATTCFPMALDEAHQRLFVGCRRPTRFLVLDTANAKMSASPEIAGDTDDLIYDPARRRVYVTGVKGSLTSCSKRTPITKRPHRTYPTPAGTRTGLSIPE